MTAPKPGGKGLELEEILKAYFWQAGYFVVRGVPYRIDDEDITDVDLWLYERPAASTRRRLIVDVKNKKSPKSAERIIWAKGLQAALGVDGSIVATTDKRPSTRRLCKTLNVVLLDGDAVSKLSQSESLKRDDQIPSAEFDGVVKRIDEGRRSAEWRQVVAEARGSLLSGMGVQSANRNLGACGYFAEQAIQAHPQSEQAQFATRLFYLCVALAAISIDFVLSDHAFQSLDERRAALTNSIRYGQSDFVTAIPTVRAAIGLARKYAENGRAVAKQIEYGFQSDAEKIPAEIIAEYVTKIAANDALFNTAREIEKASSETNLPSFDDLSVSARSLMGVILDFSEVPRDKFADSWRANNSQVSRPVSETKPTTIAQGGLPLLDPVRK